MKSRAEQLDEMSKAILAATDRIRYYKQQDKMLQSKIKRLKRNERTHRLCTRGGMIEAFIQEPEKLSDDQVMELAGEAIRRSGDGAADRSVSSASGFRSFAKHVGRSESKPLARRVRAQLYTGWLVNRCFVLSDGSCRGLDGEKEFSPSQGTLHFPCAAARLPYCAHDRKERL